ncbi:MAG: hypothetical protein ACRDTH_06940 [Pseudonocardiaceae bacterium]
MTSLPWLLALSTAEVAGAAVAGSWLAAVLAGWSSPRTHAIRVRTSAVIAASAERRLRAKPLMRPAD